MKYRLTEVIDSMKKEEVRYFKLFATRHSYRNEQKKLIQLFDVLRAKKYDEYDKDLPALFFDKKNKNAYYRLKNRLLDALEQSQAIFHRDKDDEFKVYQLLQLAKIFRYKNKNKLAAKYLEFAETVALRLEDHGLLNKVYDRLIDLSQNYKRLNPDEILVKKNKNQEQYLAIEKPNALLAKVKYQIRQSKFSGGETQIVNNLSDLIRKFETASEVTSSSVSRFKINHCAREILLQEKKFVAYADFMVQSYTKLKTDKLFTRRWHEEKMDMLSTLVDALMKVKNFVEAEAYIEEFHMSLFEFNQLNYDKYIWVYHYKRMLCAHLSGNNEQAIDIMENLKKDTQFIESSDHFENVNLHLSVLYFASADYRKAINTLSPVTKTENLRSRPKNRQIRLYLIELIIRIESGSRTKGIKIYEEIRRIIKTASTKPEINKDKMMVEILKGFLTHADPLSHQGTRKRIDLFLEKYPDPTHSLNEPLNYYLWLRSNLSDKSYYELVSEA